MEVKELTEVVEKSHKTGERLIGLTMAIFAVFLASATMLGHRAHTEEILQETLAADQWAYYQAKDIRSHLYDGDSGLAKMLGAQSASIAADFAKESVKEKNDALKIQDVARGFEKEVALASRRATFYDGAELALEVAIVLCSISLLLDGARAFWRSSFVFAGIGCLAMLWGMLAVR